MDINVEEITKIYKIYEKKEGFRNSIKALFHREEKEIVALDSINFKISSGEIVGFVGKNGSGKTTTLKILSGLLLPTEGIVRVGSYDPFQKKYEFLKQLGFVAGQKGQLRPDLPASDSFDLLMSIYNLNRNEAKKRILYLAEELSVDKYLFQPVRLLSLGQRMKCELIASLLHKPSLLLLDEPTLGLDFASAEAIRNIISREAREEGTTVILSSHILDDIQETCSSMIIIDSGKIKFNGSLDECFRSYAKNKILSIRVKENQLEKAKTIDVQSICEIEKCTVSWEVPREKMPQMVQRIMNQMIVEDVIVKEPPLGKVIEQISEIKS